MKRPLLLAYSTLGLPEAAWAEHASLARSYGFGALELRTLCGSLDLPAALRQEFGTPDAFTQAVRESGLRVVSLDSSMRLYQPDPKHKKEVAELALWASAASIPYLRIFDGGEHGSGKHSELRASMLDELEAWHCLKKAEGFSCDVMVETHWALTNPHDALKLAEESEGRLHLLWDSCHTWFHSGIPLSDTWKLLKPWVRHIHIKDILRDPAAKHGLRYALPGEGDLEIPALLDELARDGFSGTVSLEWEKLWHPELPPLEEALQSGRRHGWW